MESNTELDMQIDLSNIGLEPVIPDNDRQRWRSMPLGNMFTIYRL